MSCNGRFQGYHLMAKIQVFISFIADTIMVIHGILKHFESNACLPSRFLKHLSRLSQVFFENREHVGIIREV